LNLADSSGWLEVLLGGPNEGLFEPLLADTGALLVSALVMYEVTRKAHILRGEAYAEAVQHFLHRGMFLELSESITTRAIRLSIAHKLATADSLIYATALEYEATLWTQDKHFQGLPGAQYFDKTT
jgi:predicted nucleic acid-binding protein